MKDVKDNQSLILAQLNEKQSQNRATVAINKDDDSNSSSNSDWSQVFKKSLKKPIYKPPPIIKSPNKFAALYSTDNAQWDSDEGDNILIPLTVEQVLNRNLPDKQIINQTKEKVIKYNKRPKKLGKFYILHMEQLPVREVKKFLIDLGILKQYLTDIDNVGLNVYQIVCPKDAVAAIKQILINSGFEVTDNYDRTVPRSKKVPQRIWDDVKARAIKKMAKSLWWARNRSTNTRLIEFRENEVASYGPEISKQVEKHVKLFNTDPDYFIYNKRMTNKRGDSPLTLSQLNPPTSSSEVVSLSPSSGLHINKNLIINNEYDTDSDGSGFESNTTEIPRPSTSKRPRASSSIDSLSDISNDSLPEDTQDFPAGTAHNMVVDHADV